LDLDFSESDLLEDLLVAVPLFLKDGNYYRWAHKSLQEYFTAQFIYLDLGENKNSFLQSLYVHEALEKFLNVLDLFYDMDYKSFRNIIIYHILKEFFENYKTNEKLLMNLLSEDEIIERSEQSFKLALYVSKTNNETLKAKYKVEICGPYKRKHQLISKYIQVNSFAENNHCIIGLLGNKKNQIIKIRNNIGLIAPAWNVQAKDIVGIMKDNDSFEMHSNKKNLLFDAGHSNLELNLWRTDKYSDFVIDYRKAINVLKEIEKDLTNGAEKSELSKF